MPIIQNIANFNAQILVYGTALYKDIVCDNHSAGPQLLKGESIGFSQKLTIMKLSLYTMVELCNYPADKDSIKNRIIWDVLIVGCANFHAKDKIIRKGLEATLNDVIEILQLEESASRTLQTIDLEVRSIHCPRYDKRKGNSRNDKSRSSSTKNEYSSSRNSDSTESTPLCYRYCQPFTKGHLNNCKAIDAECNHCQLKGHFKKYCKKAGNFPKNENSNKKNVHTSTAHKAVDY